MVQQYLSGKFYQILLFALIVPAFSYAQVPIWVETFGTTGGVCDQLTTANGFISTNGTWTINATGNNDVTANEWYISATEPGKAAGLCSFSGCDSSSTLTDRTLHVGNVINSPNYITLCPTGDCGAIYDPGGFQTAVETNKRAESPTINLTGFTNLILVFNYFENGDVSNNDNTIIEFFDGTSWSTLADPPRTAQTCGQGYGLWTRYSVSLPASADNNPNARIGFRWTNDNGGIGTNPSFAVDSIQIYSLDVPEGEFFVSDTVICAGDCITFTDSSTGNPTNWLWNFIGGTPAVSTDQNPASVCYTNPGTYTVQLTVSNAAGTHTMTKTNYITVNPCVPPVADFAADTTTFCERSCINFTDLSTNGATGWTWLFPGGTPSTSTSPNPQNICYSTPGTYPVTLIASNAFGSDTLTIPNYLTVNLCPLPEADFVTFTPEICADRCVSFFDVSTFGPILSWQWYFPGATPDTSSLQNPVNICYEEDGLYDVQLIATNQYGSDTIIKYSIIRVESVPNAVISPDTAMFFGSSYQLNAGGGISYLWSPPAGLDSINIPNPVASPTVTTTYNVTITDADGCETVRQVTVTILHFNNFYVPSAFSPNGDGNNDLLFVRGNNLYGVRFTIFDRWGEKVFETTDQSQGWDGTYKGKELDPAVFTYVLTINFDDGKSANHSGTVTLIR